MENSPRCETNEKSSTLSVDVEPFIPRQQRSQTNCQHVSSPTTTTTTNGNQQIQSIPPYITTCYPFVQEDSVRCDYKSAPWSTYVPNVSMQLSFQYQNVDVPSSSFHQIRSYSRYPQSQLSPRYRTGYYARFKPDQHVGWDVSDKKKIWSPANYLDLQQQEMYFHHQQDENSCGGHLMTSRDQNISPRTFPSRFKTNFARRGNRQNAKDNLRENCTSETSSTDLSSQSSSRSHVRTLGDFFAHVKTVKRSKSLPNSAAKLDSTRGKSSKSAASTARTIHGAIEKCPSEWPATMPSNMDDKNLKPSLEASLMKPKSFADIIKSRPNENRQNATSRVGWQNGSVDEPKVWSTNDRNQHQHQQKYRCTKANQYFHQPKYYTDISPRCIVNAVIPNINPQNQENVRCSASLSDVRALKTPRDLNEIQRRMMPNKREDKRGVDDRNKGGKGKGGKSIFENISSSESCSECGSAGFVCDCPSISGYEFDRGERKSQEIKPSTWRYSSRFRSSGNSKSSCESFVENSPRFSKEKCDFNRPKSRSCKTNCDVVELTTTDKKKKKKNVKEKNQSRKDQLALVQGKMVLLPPEVYSKLFRTSSSSQEARNCDVVATSRLDNEEDYPELGADVKETISQMKQLCIQGNEDEDWSDMESECEMSDGCFSARGVTPSTSAVPLSYSAAVKQVTDKVDPIASTSQEQQMGIRKVNPKKTRNQKKKNQNTTSAGDTNVKPKSVKPKMNAPFQLNISQMLSQFEKKKKNKRTKATFSVNNRTHSKDTRGSKMFPMVANILDSTAPVRRRGKERETPAKKHPSALKKIILREREQRKLLRQMDEEKRKRIISGSSDGEVQDSAWETQGSNSSATPSLCGGEEEQIPIVAPSSSVAKSLLHSRRFREYCNHTLNAEIDAVVTRLLQDLIRFHTRLYHKDPVKAKSRRRVVLGLREVTKHLKLKRLKCIILAPNLDRIKSKGGLDDAIDSILTLAREQNVPYVFALGRKPLGKVCYKQVPVSCVGIFNYSGSESNFNQLMELVARAHDEYRGMLNQVEATEQQQQTPRTAEEEDTTTAVITSS